jgi:site-specific DNA-methyltransferase (adenine-specific)
MKPYYEHAGITIYHGDCREILPGLEMADAVVTDPPFGISWARATWEDSMEAYPELMRWLVAECNRLVINGWCFVFQAMPNAPRFHEWFPEKWRIYAACKNFAQIRPTGIWHSWDPVVFWGNGEACRNQEAVNRDYFVGNVAGVFLQEREHPCHKPIDTMEHIVSIASLPDSLLIDPFMGSGTTLRAAKDLGRSAIGIEIEEKYCEIAAKRLSQEVFNFSEAKP